MKHAISNDKETTIETLKEHVLNFVSERDWEKYHTPRNLCMSLSVEVAELMELFLYSDSEEAKNIIETRIEDVEGEVADIAMFLVSFCTANGIDLSKAIQKKLKNIHARYPVDKIKGKLPTKKDYR